MFAAVRRRMFVVGWIVPVHPASDAWLVSGHFTAFPKSAPREIAEAAAGEIIRHPNCSAATRPCSGRPADLRDELHSVIGLDLTDLVVLPPHEAQDGR